MARREDKEAFVTLATNDTYAIGCLVLGSSLKRAGTTRQLAVMITPGVSQSMRDQLERVFNLVYDVDLLDSRDPTNLQLLGRPDLNVTFTKFHCWRLTMYDKAVFLDADTLVVQNVDDLFDREELSAAPDAGWPDCFNSGVFVFKPSEETYNAILQFALDQGSFDGGDQGLLNMFFRDWATKDISRHLPFVYNVVSQAFYSYLPAFKQFKNNVKIVHFIGATKPWHQPYNTSTGEVNPLPGSGHNQEFLQQWWSIFMSDVQSLLDPTLMSMLTTTPQNKVQKHDNEPKPNLPSVFPFVPPQVDNVFYEENHSDSSKVDNCDNSRPPLMDIPRCYTELEGHYSEGPMTTHDGSNPSIIYDAPKVVQTWIPTKEADIPDSSHNHCHNDCHSEDSQTKNEQSSHVDTCDNQEKIISNSIKSDNHCNENNQSEDKENIGNSEEFIPEVSSRSVNLMRDQSINQSEDMENVGKSGGVIRKEGLVGQLATLRVSSGYEPGPPLSSQERKLNWEKGQIDYLGADSFDNIQKKLEESLSKPPEPTKEASSPFSRPLTEPVSSTPKESVSISSEPSAPSGSSVPESPEPSPLVSAVPESTATCTSSANEKASLEFTPPEVSVLSKADESSVKASPPTGKPEVKPKPTLAIQAAPKVQAIEASKPSAPAPKPESPPSAVPKVAPKPSTPTSKSAPEPAPKPTTPTSTAPKVGLKKTVSEPVAKPVTPTSATKDPPKVPSKPTSPTSTKPTSPTSPATKDPPNVPSKPGIASKFGLKVATKEPTTPPKTNSPGSASTKTGPPTFPKPETPTTPSGPSGVASRFGAWVGQKPTTPTSPTSASTEASGNSASKPAPKPTTPGKSE